MIEYPLSSKPGLVAIRLDTARWMPGAILAAICSLAGVLAGVQPALAIGAAFATAFALIAFADLTAGLVVYTGIIFIEPGLLQKVLIASTIILGLAWLARVTTHREQAAGEIFFVRHRVAGYLFVLFFAWGLLSATWAQSSTDTFVDLSRYLLNIALFVIAYTAIQTRRQAGWALGGFVFAAAVVALVAPLIRPDFLTPHLAPVPGTVGADTSRFTGSLADPNEFAAVLIPALALSLGAIGALRGSSGLRLAAGAAAGLCLVSFFLTASRGGLVGLAVALVAGVLAAGRWRLQAVMALLVLAMSAFVYFSAFAPESVRQRIDEPTQGESRVKLSRVTLWQVAWQMIQDRPVEGVGLGNFENASPAYIFQPGVGFRIDAVVDQRQPAHNTYLHLFAELGVPGGLLFLAIVCLPMGATAVAARNFRRLGDQRMEIMARALIAGQAGILAAIAFFSAQSVNKLWLVLAFGPALLAVSRASPTPARSSLKT
jgi:O-antigen ligase